MIANHRGGRTQISDSKVSKPEKSKLVEKHDFYLLHLHLAPQLGVTCQQGHADRKNLLQQNPTVLNCGYR